MVGAARARNTRWGTGLGPGPSRIRSAGCAVAADGRVSCISVVTDARVPNQEDLAPRSVAREGEALLSAGFLVNEGLEAAKPSRKGDHHKSTRPPHPSTARPDEAGLRLRLVQSLAPVWSRQSTDRGRRIADGKTRSRPCSRARLRNLARNARMSNVALRREYGGASVLSACCQRVDSMYLRCTCDILAIYLRYISLVLPLCPCGDFRSPAGPPPSPCLFLTALVCPIFKRNHVFPQSPSRVLSHAVNLGSRRAADR